MVKVDKHLMEHVAEIARLKLDDNELERFTADFMDILSYFSIIDEAKVSKEKPSFQPVEIENVMREDLVEESLSREDILSLTEHKKDGYFKGPKAV